ncbi:MAG: hypothetical protein JRH15_12660 [Deltaproteobacteria bacterium]|nr:hypothetical protein [Deltaproteobacteria bacterium]
MKTWRRTFHPFIAVLLILLISPTAALPQGVHLNLCIGFNGHTDISLDDCSIDSMQLCRWQDLILYGESQQDNCLDIAFGCTASDKQVLYLRNVDSLKTKVQFYNFPEPMGSYLFSFPPEISQYPMGTSPQLRYGALLASDLVSIRTIVLLI